MTDQNALSVMGATEPAAENVVPTTPVESTPPAPATPAVAQDKPLKTLQEELVALGFPADKAKKIMSKDVAQAVLDSLGASKKAVAAPATEIAKVDTLDEKPNPREEKQLEKQYLSRRDIMRTKLESQPQVPIFIQKSDTEPAGVVKIVKVAGKNEYVHVGGVVEVFTLNGYQVIVPKGVQAIVPLQIFQLWSDSMRLTQQAGSQFSVNRIDPATGQPVSNRL
jgi:hypothetical protein